MWSRYKGGSASGKYVRSEKCGLVFSDRTHFAHVLNSSLILPASAAQILLRVSSVLEV